MAGCRCPASQATQGQGRLLFAHRNGLRSNLRAWAFHGKKHRKTMGKVVVFHGISWCSGSSGSSGKRVNVYTLLWKMAIDIVDSPINSMVMCSIVMLVYQRVSIPLKYTGRHSGVIHGCLLPGLTTKVVSGWEVGCVSSKSHWGDGFVR